MRITRLIQNITYVLTKCYGVMYLSIYVIYWKVIYHCHEFQLSRSLIFILFLERLFDHHFSCNIPYNLYSNLVLINKCYSIKLNLDVLIHIPLGPIFILRLQELVWFWYVYCYSIMSSAYTCLINNLYKAIITCHKFSWIDPDWKLIKNISNAELISTLKSVNNSNRWQGERITVNDLAWGINKQRIHRNNELALYLCLTVWI